MSTCDGEVLPWVDHLASREDDELGAEVERKAGKHPYVEESSEASSLPRCDVFLDSAWVFPVAETEAVMARSAAPE